MMMGEIGSETRYDGNLVAQMIYIFYAFLVVILLSNVLIAIVTDSYEIIQNDRAAIVFWSNRLDFVAEMDGIASVVRQRILCMGDKKKGAPGAPTKAQEGLNGTIALGSKDWLREAWTSITFESNVFDDADLHPSKIEFWVYLCYEGVALFLIIPVWLVLGMATAGVLWPPQVREYIFVQKETAVSRSEIERQKLEQLREIQSDVKTLKTEISKEMTSDRDDMVRMKAEVEAVQIEYLSDLQQMKELMTTLLDLGGIAHDS
jgi:glycerol-3-phosphate cytidylyltransferase-like family protein